MSTLELKIPPILIAGLSALFMWLVAAYTPISEMTGEVRTIIVFALMVVGIGFGASGVLSFRRAQTTVNPHEPENSSSLVTGGIYRTSRNPMYTGLVFMLAAWGIFLSSVFSLAIIAVFVLYMNRFQIAPEEIALNSLFSEEYQSYCARVRRWL